MLAAYIKFPLYLIFHPFQGYWDLKYENKGKLRLSILFIFLLIVVSILKRQYTGFIVNFNNPLTLNSLDELQFIVLPFLLWCVGNWSLTTLMDGEGKFAEIVTAAGYAVIPLIIVYIPQILYSNVITLEESAFYYIMNNVATIWFVWLLFVGTMTVHQYTVTKTIVTIALTLVVMGIIIFLGLLFFSFIQQIAAFAATIYQELTFRM